ncbi:hypothetical protein I4U23_021916 [Adineta vaga]|nr:hypothetical protein I4U23_021916 [Adineta vaga]
MLLSKLDRFRQRTEFFMRTHTIPWRSSQLGLDVFLALAEKHFTFGTISPYASVVTFLAFEKLQIDDIDHLVELMKREKHQIEAELKVSESKDKNVQMNQSYMKVPHTVSTPVLSHFIKMIESEIDETMKAETETLSSEAQVQYIERLLNASIFHWTTVGTQERMFLDMAQRILNNITINVRIRAMIVFSLGYCSTGGLPILQAEILKVESFELLPIAVSSYCYCIRRTYNAQDDSARTIIQSSLESIISLLNHSSDDVAQAAADGLASVYAAWDDGLSVLLDTLQHDHIRAYTALLNATKDLTDNAINQKCVHRAAELIEQYSSSLLPLFLLELYHSIKYFHTSVLLIRSPPGYRGINATVEVAALLVRKMPAA